MMRLSHFSIALMLFSATLVFASGRVSVKIEQERDGKRNYQLVSQESENGKITVLRNSDAFCDEPAKSGKFEIEKSDAKKFESDFAILRQIAIRQTGEKTKIYGMPEMTQPTTGFVPHSVRHLLYLDGRQVIITKDQPAYGFMGSVLKMACQKGTR